MRKEAKTSEAGGKAEKFRAEDRAEEQRKKRRSSGQKTSEAGGEAEKFQAEDRAEEQKEVPGRSGDAVVSALFAAAAWAQRPRGECRHASPLNINVVD